MKLLTLVVPCYNEVNSLPKLITKIKEVDKSINFIILDNGSFDGSTDYLKKIESQLQQNISILFINKNDGYGFGVLEGLKSISNSEFIGWIHGDLQFDFIGLDRLLDYLSSSKGSSTSIFYKGIRKGRKALDRLFSYVMGASASVILGMKFKEINAQPTVFSNSLLTFVNEPPKDFNFDTYIYWLALKNNFKVKRDFYNFPPREYGESKWDFGLSSKIKFSISLLKYFFKLKKTNKSYSQ